MWKTDQGGTTRELAVARSGSERRSTGISTARGRGSKIGNNSISRGKLRTSIRFRIRAWEGSQRKIRYRIPDREGSRRKNRHRDGVATRLAVEDPVPDPRSRALAVGPG